MKILTSASPFLSHYNALICDVWGVLHNGVQAYPAAISALQNFRAGGGKVILVSNAPRPAANIWLFLESLNIPRDICDDFITSGDLTLGWLRANEALPIHWIGAQRDMPLFDGLQTELTDIHTAQAILCTGLQDDTTQTPDDYKGVLTIGQQRGLPFICANPDLTVERGTAQVYCAGAIAQAYEQLGGKVEYFGKPYAPIYDEAFARLGLTLADKAQALAIGDALRTDIAGASRYGINSLFITGGIHAREFADLANAGQSALLAPFSGSIKGIMRGLE